MDQQVRQGWHDDPFGRHERRYFSAGQPTKLVRDGGIEAYDEPPAWQTGTAVDAAPAFASPSDTHGPDPARGNTPPEIAFSVKRRRTGLVNATVAAVTAALVVVAVAIAGGFSPRHRATSGGAAPPGASLAALVTRSARTTLAQKTADISLRGTFDLGQSIQMRGTGQADFGANTLDMSLRTITPGITLVENEIMTGHAFYMQVIVNGRGFNGRHWVEVPIAHPSQIEPQDNASSLLRLLERGGAKVTRIGTQKIGGLNCTEVKVTPTIQAMIGAMQQESANDGLSSSDGAAAQKLAKNSPPLSLTFWFDPKRNLTCQLAIDIQLGIALPSAASSAPSTESAQMLITFTHYGVPVHITPPPPSDTVSF